MARQIKTVAAATLSVILFGCGNSEGNDIKSAQAAVSQKLKDPGSAQYGKAFVAPASESSETYANLRYVCGDVNAKNSFGGYTGATRYKVLLAEPAKGGGTQVLYTEMEAQPNDHIFTQVWWNNGCKST